MNRLVQLTTILIIALIAGCAHKPQANLSDFDKALISDYEDEQIKCTTQLRHNCAGFFKYKIEEVKKGNTTPSAIPPVSVQGKDREELTKARLILDALLSKSNDTLVTNPEQTAKLQYYYECWLEQLKFGYSDISNCRDNFNSQIGKLLHRIDSEKHFINYANDIHSVYFILDSDRIEQQSTKVMQNLIAELNKVETPMQIVIYGYTDRVGKKPYNNKLSQRRVKVVKDILLNSGAIPEENITTKAFGENDPLINAKTIINNPHSRRVDIFLYRKDGGPN